MTWKPLLKTLDTLNDEIGDVSVEEVHVYAVQPPCIQKKPITTIL
jgi:hypothetical protein